MIHFPGPFVQKGGGAGPLATALLHEVELVP